MQQTAGFTVVADKLNMVRYLSHFRSIHRGQYFTEMKTTTVRKLLPESWGFMCPVHTPDGSPCGLLNHITLSCIPLPTEDLNMAKETGKFKQLLCSLGMNPIQTDFSLVYPHNHLNIMLDGKLMGVVDPKLASHLVNQLRAIKIRETPKEDLHTCVPKTIEIAFLPSSETNQNLDASSTSASEGSSEMKEKFFPGIFLSTAPSRFIRPVKNLEHGGIEFIGPLEQVNLSIACLEEDLRSDSTHQEMDPINMLSIIASTIPFANYNQSPRNMYQCQMAKQTMGTPYHNHPYRMDNKIYRILFPQAPLVRTENHTKYDFGLCPQGTNAVVAVISYTGYDMEDAMIMNKGAYERGFAHGCVYKSYYKELNDQTAGNSAHKSRFKMFHDKNKQKMPGVDELDLSEHGLMADGLPNIGKKLT